MCLWIRIPEYTEKDEYMSVCVLDILYVLMFMNKGKKIKKENMLCLSESVWLITESLLLQGTLQSLQDSTGPLLTKLDRI